MPDVCVVHLVWAPLGPQALRRFTASYREHAAGMDHRLVLVFKGFSDSGPGAAHLGAIDGLAHEALHYSRPTLDLPAYAWCAEALDATHLCFLNSESVLLADGWLAALFEQLRAPGVGAVGATGSYERPFSINPLRRRRWPPFPNPHLRTNAFMLSRELMRSLRWPEVRTKSRAWELESGRDGFTRQVWGRGLQTIVVGRDGAAYAPDRWHDSATFRSGGQANLLVADNRTRQWDEADADVRTRLSRLAWGDDPDGVAARVRAAMERGAQPAQTPSSGGAGSGGPMRASGA
jgi:hypothetical protein